MLYIVKLLFVGLLFSFHVCVHSTLVGGVSGITEKEFNAIEGVNLEMLANSKFDKESENSNELPLKYVTYICGTKQVVAGMLYKAQFLACRITSNSKNCVQELPPSKCNATYLYQPWLLAGAPISAMSIKCSEIEKKDLGTISTCTLMHNSNIRKKRDIMTMERIDEDRHEMFNNFIQKYNKPYSDPNSEEYHRRYLIFERNLRIAQDLNMLELGTATYGVTEFMDYSEDEYRRYLAPGLMERKVSIRTVEMDDVDVESMPASFDWRKEGAVTNVKNQGSCGSCWAFSTTGNIEGQWFIAKKKLVSLSEQELVDCDKVDQGCNGGLPANAYKQIEKLGGLETEKEYPYEGEDERCKFKRSDVRVYINDSVSLPTDENKLAQWLAQHGPISIGINANAMQFYFGGISHPWRIFCNPSNLDHGVLIVGYGTKNGTPYWIIKNSWGASWGENGYYLVYRGGGCCGLNRMATSALVK